MSAPASIRAKTRRGSPSPSAARRSASLGGSESGSRPALLLSDIHLSPCPPRQEFSNQPRREALGAKRCDQLLCDRLESLPCLTHDVLESHRQRSGQPPGRRDGEPGNYLEPAGSTCMFNVYQFASKLT